MKHLMRYQFVECPIAWDDPDMPAIYEKFYFYSQGIIDATKKLFIAAQHYAIHNNVEKLSLEVLQYAWFTYLSDLDKYTKLLREKRYDEMGQKPDYPAETIQQMIKRAEAIENAKPKLVKKKENSNSDKSDNSNSGNDENLSKNDSNETTDKKPTADQEEKTELPAGDLRRSIYESDKSVEQALIEMGSIGSLDDFT